MPIEQDAEAERLRAFWQEHMEYTLTSIERGFDEFIAEWVACDHEAYDYE